jgi:hypothetical protein
MFVHLSPSNLEKASDNDISNCMINFVYLTSHYSEHCYRNCHCSTSTFLYPGTTVNQVLVDECLIFVFSSYSLDLKLHWQIQSQFRTEIVVLILLCPHHFYNTLHPYSSWIPIYKQERQGFKNVIYYNENLSINLLGYYWPHCSDSYILFCVFASPTPFL